MTLIGDTGALLALYDKDDDYHDAVLSVIEKTSTIINLCTFASFASFAPLALKK